MNAISYFVESTRVAGGTNPCVFFVLRGYLATIEIAVTTNRIVIKSIYHPSDDRSVIELDVCYMRTKIVVNGLRRMTNSGRFTASDLASLLDRLSACIDPS